MANSEKTILDPQSYIPLHAQLEKIIRAKISAGVWKENDLIPSENELSKFYGVSRATVRTVLVKLAQEGVLYRVPGKGTFVSINKIVGKPLAQAGIREQLDRMGFANTTTLLSASRLEASAGIAKKLEIETGAPVFEIVRVRSLDDNPFSLHHSYIPAILCPDFLSKGFDFEHMQLCDILEQEYHVGHDEMIETLEVVKARADEAQQLKTKKNFPLLHLEDTIFNPNGTPLEYSSVLFRGDQMKIEICNTYTHSK